VLRKGELGSFGFNAGPASLASEATMISTSQFRNARWLEKDDRLLRAMSKAGEGLTLMTVKPNRPMTSVKVVPSTPALSRQLYSK
jgi:hypothetical protein